MNNKDVKRLLDIYSILQISAPAEYANMVCFEGFDLNRNIREQYLADTMLNKKAYSWVKHVSNKPGVPKSIDYYKILIERFTKVQEGWAILGTDQIRYILQLEATTIDRD